MSVKPILFNTEMVRAILAGRKTVTRRVVHSPLLYTRDTLPDVVEESKLPRYWDFGWHGEKVGFATKAPYQPGDILYVRETWNYGYFDSSDAELDNSRWFEPLPLDYDRNSYIGSVAGFVYRADFTRPEEYEYGTLDENNVPKPMPWRPSIHMPREAARIFLRVTDVRVERLQAISYEDLQREGGKSDFYKVKRCRACGYGEPHYPECDYEHCDNYEGLWKESFFTPFMKFWDSTIKPADRERYGWAANPWVWVIEFEQCDAPPQWGVQSATGQSLALSAEQKPKVTP